MYQPHCSYLISMISDKRANMDVFASLERPSRGRKVAGLELGVATRVAVRDPAS